MKYIFAIIVASLVLIAMDATIHGHLLSDIYSQTSKLWRSEGEMNVVHANIYDALYVTFFVLFYSAVVKSRSLESGARFGFFYGLVGGLASAAAWLYMPISIELAAIWFGVTLVQSVIVGGIVGKFLK